MGSEVAYALERFRKDDTGAAPPTERNRFEQILGRHHRRLRRVVAGMLGDPDRVDDVLQEAYLKAYRRLPKRFANEAHEATWLYRVVYRCCLDELRRRRRERESPSANVHLLAPRVDSLRRLDVERAVAGLAPTDRAVLLLVDLVGLDYAAAAAVLRVPRGTVASRLSAARGRLRERLDA
jgi:RNA polymerase sigma-70 factor (ECF subfamily)